MLYHSKEDNQQEKSIDKKIRARIHIAEDHNKLDVPYIKAGDCDIGCKQHILKVDPKDVVYL